MERVTFSATGEMHGNTLVGVAHAFGKRTLVGNTYVEFERHAFDEALQTSDVRAFWNHDTTLLLGRESAGTLKLSAEDDGLHYAIDLPPTSYVADMKVLIDRGDLKEMSFGVMPGKVTAAKAMDGKRVQRHSSVKELFDISPVSLPAFEGTSIQLHSLEHFVESVRNQTIRARARVNRS